MERACTDADSSILDGVEKGEVRWWSKTVNGGAIVQHRTDEGIIQREKDFAVASREGMKEIEIKSLKVLPECGKYIDIGEKNGLKVEDCG